MKQASPKLLLLLAILFFSATTVFAVSEDVCLVCHAEKSLTKEDRGHVRSLFVDGTTFTKSAHGELDCVSCHEGFHVDQLPHAQKIKPVDCSSCHADQQFVNYKQSVHGKVKSGRAAVSCAACHSTHAIQKISDRDSLQRKEFGVQICESCHTDVKKKFMASEHGKARARHAKAAPSCLDCHGVHDVASPTAEGAPTNRKLIANKCLSCHLDNADVRAKVGPSAGFIASYENSVHGQAMKNGNEMAATCTDCHGAHDMSKASSGSSTVSKKNIAATCGNCHGDIQAQYEGSIHGKALASGVSASATCTDCHGEHNILSRKNPLSPVAAKNVSGQVCSPCHSSVKLTQKFGLASDRYQSFEDSYHGLAGKAGSVLVANCASCHGVHNIKPSTDSTSRISPKNLAQTCGTCHPGANVNFTKGSVHVIATTASNNDILYYVATGYILLLILTIGGMLVHNVLDFIKKAKRQLLYRRGILQHKKVSHRLYLRMSLNERIQHGTLAISFFALVGTGFALRFPDAWWVAGVRVISPIMFELRGISHRLAGVIMLLAGIYHVYYVVVIPRGKKLLHDLLPVRSDLFDAIGIIKYNLNLSKRKPLLGRFSYIEKMEYWALIWGTIVMALTGFILWFDNTFLGLITKSWWDVARTIHYYEAWLATLAILVWHFYFVIFNPDSYPLNVAFWKGTLTEEEMLEEHPLELLELKHHEELDRESRIKNETVEIEEKILIPEE